MRTYAVVELRVHGHDEDECGVDASEGGQQQEAGEVGVVVVPADSCC